MIQKLDDFEYRVLSWRRAKRPLLNSSREIIFQLVCELSPRGESGRGGVSDSISSAADWVCWGGCGVTTGECLSLFSSLSPPPSRLPVEPTRETLFSLNPAGAGLHTPDPHHTHGNTHKLTKCGMKTAEDLRSKTSALYFLRCHATHSYLCVCSCDISTQTPLWHSRQTRNTAGD